jgi:hypothetical protein
MTGRRKGRRLAASPLRLSRAMIRDAFSVQPRQPKRNTNRLRNLAPRRQSFSIKRWSVTPAEVPAKPVVLNQSPSFQPDPPGLRKLRLEFPRLSL